MHDVTRQRVRGNDYFSNESYIRARYDQDFTTVLDFTEDEDDARALILRIPFEYQDAAPGVDEKCKNVPATMR